MPENLPGNIAETFPAELRTLYSLSLLSLGFGALALASGLWFIVAAFLAPAFGVFQLVQALAGWAALIVGLRWLTSGWRILSGVSPILQDYQALEGAAAGESGAIGAAGDGKIPGPPNQESKPVPGALRLDALGGLVRRMMIHYRENWKTWWKMAPLSRMGGCIFILLGLLEFFQGYTAWHTAATESYLLPLLVGGIFIALGAEAFILSARFQGSARTWEQRLIEAGQGEEILPDSREQGGS